MDVSGANPAHYTDLPGSTPPFAAPLGRTVTVGSHTFSALYTGHDQLTVQNDLASSTYPDAFAAVADVKLGNTFALAPLVLGDKTGNGASVDRAALKAWTSVFTVGASNLISPNGNGTNIFEGPINLTAVPSPSRSCWPELHAWRAWVCGRARNRR